MSLALRCTHISCGIHQVTGLQDVTLEELVVHLELAFQKFTDSIGGARYSADMLTTSMWIEDKRQAKEKVYPPAMIIFSDAEPHTAEFGKTCGGHGHRLMESINNAGEYGHCTKIGPVPNTNSENNIALFVWALSPEWIHRFWRTRNPGLQSMFDAAEATKAAKKTKRGSPKKASKAK